MNITDLPELSIFNILCFLDTKTLCKSFFPTCSKFNQFSSQKYIWYEKIINEFPFNELMEKFDLEKDWKSLYKRYYQPIEGRYFNFGTFLVGNRIFQVNYNYFYYLKEDHQSKDVVIHGGKPDGNLLYGHKRGDILIFTQISGGFTYSAASVCKVLDNKLIRGIWYANTKESGKFMSFKQEKSVNLDMTIDNDELKEFKKIFEVNEMETSKETYGFDDGIYIASILWDASKKVTRELELNITKEFENEIGWIIKGEELKNQFKIYGILTEGICSMILTKYTERFHICLFLKNNDKKNFNGFWYQILKYNQDLTVELTKSDYPEKYPFTCTKKEVKNEK